MLSIILYNILTLFPLLSLEPRCVFLQSPAYVFGDIHGNLEDLQAPW